MRRRAGRAAAIGVLALVTACRDDADRANPTTTDPVSSPTTTLASTTPSSTTTEVALTGDPLVITEQGVATFPDPFDPTATLGGYGVVLHNPNSTVMATGIRVVTRILDDAGTELLVDSSLLNAILPGQRMAVGRTLVEPIEGPSRLDVTVEVGAWLMPATRDGLLVAEGVVTEPEEAGGSVTKFTVRSTWPETEDGVDVTAVYRALDGRILGAEYGTVEVVPSGESVPGQIRLLSPIPDLATTEVFVGRGFAALTTG